MAEKANPEGYGRRPEDGPSVSQAEINARQAAALSRTNNGKLEDGKLRPWITPERSKTA